MPVSRRSLEKTGLRGGTGVDRWHRSAVHGLHLGSFPSLHSDAGTISMKGPCHAAEGKPPCLCDHHARPEAPPAAVVAGGLVLPDAGRTTAADSADLAGRRLECRPAVGIQL